MNYSLTKRIILSAPIIWYIKIQATVESSTFGSDFIALRTCVEHIIALRLKLRMFGIPIDGESRILNDNKSVMGSSSKLKSTLKKNPTSIEYHFVGCNLVEGFVRTGWIEGI